jgi:tRNA threonylcarbamoyl adenosine modification protein (Sua5/YciO/YrdC/YwlC family)
MIRKIYIENPNPKEVERVVDILKNGGVIIYPTDTIYGMGCDIHNHKAVERVAQIKGIKPEKANFSIICHDLSSLSNYARQVDNKTFKLMKISLPGPFTFILNASNKVPKIFLSKKKTIGIRIPDNNIILTIAKEFGSPILTTSIHDDDELLEYSTDPELIHEKYEKMVDLVIDGGYGGMIPSTVFDCTGPEPVLVREGAGSIDKSQMN